MRLPHQLDFAHRKRLLHLIVVLGAIGGAFWPELEWQDRLLAPIAIIILATVYYFLAIGFVKFHSLLSPDLRKPSSYLLFYGTLLVLIAFPAIVVIERHELLAQPPLLQALTIPGFLPIALATAAGALRELHHDPRAA